MKDFQCWRVMGDAEVHGFTPGRGDGFKREGVDRAQQQSPDQVCRAASLAIAHAE
jgi:hypothetical protein